MSATLCKTELVYEPVRVYGIADLNKFFGYDPSASDPGPRGAQNARRHNRTLKRRRRMAKRSRA